MPRSQTNRPSLAWAVAILLALAILAGGGLTLRATGGIPSTHAYYIPSESMMPTLVKNDHILAATGISAPFARGDVILFLTRTDATYIQRVVGLPGDRVGMAGGKVVLNGRTIPQQALATEDVPGNSRYPRAVRLSERFPGEAQPHQIYDSGVSMGDDLAEQVVAPDHLFLLGDNRDNSADSRFGLDLGGVSQVAIADVVARAPVYTAARGRAFLQPVH